MFLSALIFLPIAAMALLLFVPKENVKALRMLTVIVTGLQLVIALYLYMNFNSGMNGVNDAGTYQFKEQFKWIRLDAGPILGKVAIDYFIGIDGISMPMIILTTLVSFVAAFASFSINHSYKGYFMMFLLLDAAMVGVFVSLDFFLFYLFWELMLLPMYFLIGIWGGPRREYAAIKFFLYTLFGSIFMLLAMIGLYFSVQTGVDSNGLTTAVKDIANPANNWHAFNMLAMMNPANYDAGSIFAGAATYWRTVAFIALFIGFAIKVPMFPFHTWLPDAHVEAPTAISVILAGVLLKMGIYGMIRICFSIFPDVAMLPWILNTIAAFGFINIVYGALVAMAQTDMKKLIAYSSVSHMGYCLLGLAAVNTIGVTGCVFQMFNHGVITSMLFMIVGVVYDRAHVRGVNDFGGLWNKMPRYTGLVIIAFFAAMGLPSLSGFVSEAFVFVGAFQGVVDIRMWTALSTLGIILGAAYMLWLFQRVFLGTLKEKWTDVLPDINMREGFALGILAVIIIALGVYPAPMINMMSTSVNHLVDFVTHSANVVPAVSAVIK